MRRGIAPVRRQDLPLWGETSAANWGEDAPVGVSRQTVEGIDLISRTAVYVIRMYGGVGGAEP